MALKAIISSVDEVDEALRGLYVEKDEKFFLDVESVGGYSLEDVSGLKSALSRKTEESRQRGAKLKTFDGLDPGEAREAIEKLVEFGKEPDIEAKIKEGIAVREKQRAEQHKKEMSEKDERSSHLLSQLEEHLMTANVTKAISEKKGILRIATDSTEIKNLKVRYPEKEPFEQSVISIAFDAEVDPSNKTIDVKKL